MVQGSPFTVSVLCTSSSLRPLFVFPHILFVPLVAIPPLLINSLSLPIIALLCAGSILHAETWVEDTFEDFVDGVLDASGNNISQVVVSRRIRP